MGANTDFANDVVGDGGDGLASSITGSSVARGGGGAGGAWIYNWSSHSVTLGTGGTGGGASTRTSNAAGNNGTANTGGGGAGGTDQAGNANSSIGGSGGSGVVILKIPTEFYSTTTSGSPGATTSGDFTILTYNSSGSYTG